MSGDEELDDESKKPDDTEPSPEWQAKMRAAYEENVAAGYAPYAGCLILTRGELLWVMQEREWSGKQSRSGGSLRANLSGALFGGNLSGATFGIAANLSGATFGSDVNLSGAGLAGANLSGATFSIGGNLSGADLTIANLSGATLTRVNLSGATLGHAGLWEADLTGVNLSGATLDNADLSGAKLGRATLSGADLERATLTGADLRRARMDATTNIGDAKLDTRTQLADVVWNGVPLTRLNWQDVTMLGDEEVARQPKNKVGGRKDQKTRLREYADAVLANRQVATVLRSQGLNEHADRFAYRAEFLQREVLRRQGAWGRAFGSWLLDAVSGYGYKPMRSAWTYVAVILAFAAAYYSLTNFGITPFLPTHSTPLAWYEALVLSISSFHGRGLFPTGLSLGDPVAIFAAVEAIIGLLIEITFIATFTQRFFAR